MTEKSLLRWAVTGFVTGFVTGGPRARWIQFKILRGHSDTVSSCHFCFEDTKILSCSYDGTVKLWDVEKGFPIQVFEEEHTSPISECNLTPDDRRVVTSSYDNTVKAWDMETGKALWTVEHEGIVTSCDISRDGRYVVSGSDKENSVYVLDAVSATAVAHIPGHHKSTITRCCFDPDNQRVTSVSYDKTIKLWDMITGYTSITVNEGHSNVISDCCFTSDGQYLCTASWDKSLKIWDIKTGEFWCHEPVSLTQGHRGSVSSCVFSQDASLVVSGGYDRTVAVWDTNAGCKKLSLQGHWDWVTDVAISKNKNWILSASKDSTLRLWNVEKMDHIPPVTEIGEGRGSKIAQCEECGKPFLRLQRSDSELIAKCVFCRLSAPGRKNLPLSPSVSLDL
ncbi:PREDICTED: WD repeat-containing protein 88 [Buceros rhinoceros silvestris]|uniref:WD repeat-containing protein 88 n=1 Tax=Buceros rhinoceros silvestris TaxID=175836 RepID=UPI000528DF6F|nr:PREDICTED: WD repeat-containing protein 88 [Buceros rhinoceros silvestris]